MIVVARDVFVSKCSTQVNSALAEPRWEREEAESSLRFRTGTEADLERLDRGHHDDAHVESLRARLRTGEIWVIGANGDRGPIVTYTWLHTRSEIEWPYIPGSKFRVAENTGYGYDAWTHPEARGAGIRRRAFAYELSILRLLGKSWEVSFFPAFQLEGAQRSLAKAGIIVDPLYRVRLTRHRGIALVELSHDDVVTPLFEPEASTIDEAIEPPTTHALSQHA